MTESITFLKLRSEIRRLVDAEPDYVYKTPTGVCYYNTPGLPDCIFGRALKNLGVEITGDSEGKDIVSILIVLDMRLDLLGLTWASSLQQAQDQGFSWGDAFKIAEIAQDATRIAEIAQTAALQLGNGE